MKEKNDPSHQLHLVTVEASSPASQQSTDSLIVQGLQNYKELQAQMDRALFAKPQDIETLAVVMPQLKVLRERLASYGVRVRS